MDAYGLTEAVLPELAALRGVEQNEFHHADVYGHTLEVLDAVAALERDRGSLGDRRSPPLLAEPLADELTRGGAMRFAALLHDAAKPQTRGVRPDGRVTFIGHDEAGAELARDVLRRLRASQRTVDYVAALTLHHLRLGFLVHEQPLDRRSVWRYLRATAPYTDDVTIFTVADRLATRGRNADEAIAAHVALAREMLAVDRRPPSEPLVRGDDLARELGIVPGPRLGELLAQLEEDRYAGDDRHPRGGDRARARDSGLVAPLLGSRAMPNLDQSSPIRGDVADDVTLGPFCVIAEGARIGAGARLGVARDRPPRDRSSAPGCVVQDGAVLGKPPKLARHSTRRRRAGSSRSSSRRARSICCGAIVFAGARIGAGAIVGDQAYVRERADDRRRARSSDAAARSTTTSRSARACGCRPTST